MKILAQPSNQPLRPEIFSLSSYPSPLGRIDLVHDQQDRLVALDFEDYEARRDRLLSRYFPEARIDVVTGMPTTTSNALDSYFARDFAEPDLTIRLRGSFFQLSTWTALAAIGAGSTTSYGNLAGSLGSPSAARAVGMANGANPVAIFIPCHRVIGGTGSLTGYGGGLQRKAWLLKHERGASGSPGWAAQGHLFPETYQE